MPELPEVETICRQLQKNIVGKTIKKAEVLYPKVVHGKSSADFVRVLQRRVIREVGRQGKLILIRLDGDETLVVHLKMTGRLLLQPSCHPERSEGSRTNVRNSHSREILRSPRGSLRMTDVGVTKSTEVVFTLTDGTILRYDDMRRFGYMKIVPTLEEAKVVQKEQQGPVRSRARAKGTSPSRTAGAATSNGMGIDFFDRALIVDKFRTLIRSRGGSQIKPLLLDQSLIAGVGNIYAQEACFIAKIHPFRKAGDLSDQELRALYQALRSVMMSAIKYGGTSSDDYRDAFGKMGKFAAHLKVYGRQGQPCLRCKTKLSKQSIGGRGTVFCPKCQYVA